VVVLKKYFRNSNAARVVALGLVLILAFFLIGLPYFAGKQVERARNNLLAIHEALGVLAVFPDIPLGETNAISESIVKPWQTIADKAKIIPPLPPKEIVLMRYQKHISYTFLKEAQKSTEEFARYQADSFAALTKLLQYKAEADFAVFQPGTKDASERLSRLRKGLDDTAKLLRTLGQYSDESILEVIDAVDNLKDSADALSNSPMPDTLSFIKKTTDTQKKIVENRKKFWEEGTNKHLKELSDANHDLAEIQYMFNRGR
jgi:hypothetical protein